MRALLSLLVAGLLACGCIASEQSLGSDPPDRSLVGLWLSQEDWNNNVYLHVLLDPNGEDMSVVRVNEPVTDHGGLGSAEQYRVQTTRVGTERYASVNVPEQGFLFFRYQVEGDRLRWWELEYSALAEAVNSGGLHGRAWETTREAHVHLTDGTPDLRRFVQGAGPEVWSAPREFHRVAIPPPHPPPPVP